MADGDEGGSVGGAMLGWVRVRPVRPTTAAALVVAVLVAALVVVGASGSPAEGADGAAGPSGPCAPDWTTAWQAAPQAAPGGHLGGRTLRLPVRSQVSGSQVRVRLSNRYGAAPLPIGTVSIARSASSPARPGAALLPGSVRAVTFDGAPTTVLPPGAELLSDPVPVLAEAGRSLVVSLYLPQAPEVVTEHVVALRTSYLSEPGDAALDADGAAFTTVLASWPVLTGLDVLAPRPVQAVVAIGDSITDGVGSAVDADQRWPDALAERLVAAGGDRGMAVLNAGISRNRLLADEPATGGDSPARRFDADVARVAGVTDVVLHIGTNDIAAGAGVPEIVAGLVDFAGVARAAGLRVVLTTITPSDTGAHGTPSAVAIREGVNSWVRAHGGGHADAVADFAAAVADPARPHRLAPPFDSGDGLHLSPAGYRELAAAVPLTALTGSPCLAGQRSTAVRASGG